MILGAHISAAAGLRHTLDEANRLGVAALQFRTRTTTRWFASPLEPADVVGFRQRSARFGRERLFALASPLINLTSPDETALKRSLDALYDELLRGEALGLGWVVIQPGCHEGHGEEWGIRRLTSSLNKTLERSKTFKCGLLLEISAGGEHELGSRFEQLARIRRKLDDGRRVGICLDTAKMFAAGYDLRDAAAYGRTVSELERVLGLRHVRAVHLSDSLYPLGGHTAGAAPIGQGELGTDAFAFILNDPRFAEIPLILEAPRGPGADEDSVNLKRLASLAGTVTVP